MTVIQHIRARAPSAALRNSRVPCAASAALSFMIYILLPACSCPHSSSRSTPTRLSALVSTHPLFQRFILQLSQTANPLSSPRARTSSSPPSPPSPPPSPQSLQRPQPQNYPLCLLKFVKLSSALCLLPMQRIFLPRNFLIIFQAIKYQYRPMQPVTSRLALPLVLRRLRICLHTFWIGSNDRLILMPFVIRRI